MPVGSQDRRPSLELVFATLEAVRDLRPRFWIMENVRGAIPFLGAPLQKIGPFCLWGYFPRIEAPLSVVDHRKMVSDRRTAVARAAIPYDLSEAVYQAVESAWSTARILDLRQYRRHRHVRRRAAVELNGAGRPSAAARSSTDGQVDWCE